MIPPNLMTNSANNPCRELAIQHLTQLRLIPWASPSNLYLTRLPSSNGAWYAGLVLSGVFMSFSVACDDTGLAWRRACFSSRDEAIARCLPYEAHYEPIKYVYIREQLEYDSHDTLFILSCLELVGGSEVAYLRSTRNSFRDTVNLSSSRPVGALCHMQSFLGSKIILDGAICSQVDGMTGEAKLEMCNLDALLALNHQQRPFRTTNAGKAYHNTTNGV